ncbi:macrophage mannose receptor 1-like [Boleophthalmus pectinirostris]|uniref:macrophage mannose receptor 1-like n=1 Tax=Boleophthalmus pectinirostris TaxID=150288 RepID=UPI00242A868D|nr:macrophage mannose receptor 1-like [Boleophthalmus pectinirostris]
MEALLLLTVGSLALAPVSSRQFHFVYELKTQEEARSYCRQHYTDLATVENMEDVLTLRNTVNLSRLLTPDGFYNSVWIGLYDDFTAWSWSLSDPPYNSESYTNWYPGEPNNNGGNECCVGMSSDEMWWDSHCSNVFPAMCVDLTDCFCYVPGSSETFVLTTDSFTWEEAQQYCRLHHTDLASVRDATQNSQITALLINHAWIGLRRSSWKWLDGNNSTFSYWRTEVPWQPDNEELHERCVTANFEDGGTWDDCNCDKMKPFICYGSAVKTYKIKLQLKTTSANPNEPVVTEQVLKQIKKYLEKTEASKLLKLSWIKDTDGNVFIKTDKTN